MNGKLNASFGGIRVESVDDDRFAIEPGRIEIDLVGGRSRERRIANTLRGVARRFNAAAAAVERFGKEESPTGSPDSERRTNPRRLPAREGDGR